MKFFERARGILGINARNLLYIGRYNTKNSKRFADDKIFTKNYLSSRGIGVAKIYHIIKDYNELKLFNPAQLPKSFVIKPNRGFGGEGILVITEKSGSRFIEVNGETQGWPNLFRHIGSILDGRYAISGLHDQAIIEEYLEADESLKTFLDTGGLPDIRVLVFNFVPVVAMLRLPTAASHGKANLHIGGVGVGIDIATGKATYAVQHNKFVTKLPSGQKISELELKNWDEVLLMAARAQHASQIGFLAVDLAPTKNGVKILELNARAGLQVQIANQIPLKDRLKKVADLKVPSPEKGVEVSKTLFSSNIASEKKESPDKKAVIGLYEYVDILNTKYNSVLAKIDPHLDGMLIDNSLSKIGGEVKLAKFKIKDQRFTAHYRFHDLSKEKHQVVIPGKILNSFLIDSTLNKIPPRPSGSSKKQPKEADQKIVANLDKKLAEMDSSINVLAFVKPLNLDQAKRDFFHNLSRNPHFVYREAGDKLDKLQRDLKVLPRQFIHPLFKIYVKKIKELQTKINLVRAVGKAEFQQLSEQLFGKVDKQLLEKAEEYLIANPIVPDESKLLSLKQVEKRLMEVLKIYKLSRWKLKVSSEHTADISVNRSGTIFLRAGAEFTENRLKAVIVHEIATHIFRSENARLQKLKIFEGGPYYAGTEEGLAVYNQKKLGLPLGEKDQWMAYRVIGAHLASKMSFVELFHQMKQKYNLSDESAWKTCLKAKRGLKDTNEKQAFTRDLIYFRGYNQVKDYLEKNGQQGLRRLYVGKLSLEDANNLTGDDKQYPVKFLPNYQEIREL